MNISAREESLGSEDPSISPNSLRFRATLARGHPRVVAKNAKVLKDWPGAHRKAMMRYAVDKRYGQTACTAIIDLFARSCGGWHVVKVARTKYGSSPYCRLLQYTPTILLNLQQHRRPNGRNQADLVQNQGSSQESRGKSQRVGGQRRYAFEHGARRSCPDRSSASLLTNLPKMPLLPLQINLCEPLRMYPTRPTSDLDCAKARKPTTTHYRQGGCDTDRINSGQRPSLRDRTSATGRAHHGVPNDVYRRRERDSYKARGKRAVGRWRRKIG
ncbi:hypothetical protein DFH06DRAFT_1148844 [Mycena polygramma]|nr:hypothetical protein DFH06DRAFT_1148844 [Mycena polygramma]